MKLLILGAESNIGMKLIEDLDPDIEIVAIFQESFCLENDPVKLKINKFRFNVEVLPFEVVDYKWQLFFKDRKFDYIVSCGRQPFERYANQYPLDDLQYHERSSRLVEIGRMNEFEGLFINLSSFHVYGNSPNGIPLKLKEGRYEIKPPDDSGEILSEDRFGYDSDFGISEQMYYAPKEENIYGLHCALNEKTIKSYNKGQVLNLRLPYMPIYCVPDEYVLNYGDRVNNLLLKLSKGQQLTSTLDNSEMSVYDFLTPSYVSKFISDLVFHGECIEGNYNLAGACFSEMELLKKLQEFDKKISFLDKAPDNWHKPLRYYKADNSAIKKALKDKITSLPKDLTMQGFVMDYLDNSK